MHILFLSQVLPYPLDAGPKIRAYYTLRHLARKHDVTLLTFIRPSDPRDAVTHLESICDKVYTVPMIRSRVRDLWHLTRSIAGTTPFLIARDRVPDMVAQLRTIVQGRAFDAIHADQLWMAAYALEAKQLCGHGNHPVVVLDQHNAVFQIPRRLAENESNPLKRALLTLEGRKLVRYERDICRAFDHVVWVTAEDRAALTSVAMNGSRPAHREGELTVREENRSTVIPICVDPGEQRVLQRRRNSRRVTFLGGLHWPPNAAGVSWFVREVWPLVARTVPDATLTIIGKDPPSDAVAQAQNDPHIEITGYVEDPLPYLAETGVFIVPLHAGGGMRVKILDAWCWGLPVVSTRIGAEGICVRDGENILLADTPGDFAQAVTRVLAEPKLADQLAAGGRCTVEEQYDWQRIYPAWDQVYASPSIDIVKQHVTRRV